MQNKSPLKSTIADTIQIKQTWRPQKVGVYVPLMLMRSKRERGGATMGLPWVPSGAHWVPWKLVGFLWWYFLTQWNIMQQCMFLCFVSDILLAIVASALGAQWSPLGTQHWLHIKSFSPRSGWGQWRIFERSSKTPYALLLYLCFLINCLADTCSDLDCDYI